MKVRISKETIKNAVEKMNVGNGETIAIMVSEQVNDKGLSTCMLLSSNGNVQAQSMFLAKVTKESGETMLKTYVSKDFKELIFAMTKDCEGDVELEFSDKEVKVMCGGTKCKLPLKEDGVSLAGTAPTGVIRVKADKFRRAVLCGGMSYGGVGENFKDSLGVKDEDGKLSFVSTNGVNLAKASVEYAVVNGTVPTGVLTLNAPQFVSIANKVSQEDINIGFMDGIIAIFDGNDVYLLRHSALSFPYGISTVVEKAEEYDFTFKVSRKALLNAMTVATITAAEKKMVKLFTEGGKLSITDICKDNRSVIIVKELKGEVKEVRLGVDALKVLINTSADEEVEFRGKNGDKAVYMLSSEGTAVVMKIM